MGARRAQGGGDRDELARSLRSLRDAANVSQTEAGNVAGLNQRAMSRIEAGLYLPTQEELDALLRQYQADQAAARHMRTLLAARLAQPVPKRFIVRAGPVADIQRRARQLEEAAELIEAFQPSCVIGLVQTPEYMAALFNHPEVADAADAIAERDARQRAALASGKSIVLVHTEGGLRNMLGGPEVMADQCRYLAVLARGVSPLRVGVVPTSVPLPKPMVSGFRLYDRDTLSVSSETGEMFPPDPRVVKEHAALFDDITDRAEFGDPAAVHFERIADDYAQMRGLQ